jgi:hypothetical protein
MNEQTQPPASVAKRGRPPKAETGSVQTTASSGNANRRAYKPATKLSSLVRGLARDIGDMKAEIRDINRRLS